MPSASSRRPPADDSRRLAGGHAIPKEGYCADQPYVVVLDDGAWLCVLTTGPGVEGDTAQHVVSTVSRDQGRTWSPLTDIEPHGPPESSWVMPVKTAFGRVYAIYVHNTDDRREVRSLYGPIKRVDTLGHYVMKYTEDGGRTWSAERYEIPVRAFAIDRANLYGGAVRFFWGVGKPVVDHGAARVIFGAAKVGNFGDGFMASSEGFFMCSDNLLAERDPARVRWETLPEGEIGLRAPLGPVADEHNPVVLSDGGLYCTYRTTEGFLCHAYSRDGGRTWTPPAYGTYAPAGPGVAGGTAAPAGQPPETDRPGVPAPARRIKHPRAATFVKRFSDGPDGEARYLLWFHNHGGRWYQYRNPAWVSGGTEVDGTAGKLLRWSEPEVLLYDEAPEARISYPDFIEDGGRFFVTETQKTVARVHEIDPALLDGLWRQHTLRTVAGDGLLLERRPQPGAPGDRVALPRLPAPVAGGGWSIDLWLALADPGAGQVVLDSRTAGGAGLALTTAGEGNNVSLRLQLDDGRHQASWDCDPGILGGRRPHHVVVMVDGGPKLITFVVDGRLCDGGMSRQYGWGRFPAALGDVSGAPTVAIAPTLRGALHSLRIYGRALRVSEAVGNWRAGMPGGPGAAVVAQAKGA